MPSMWGKASQGSRSKDMPVNFTSLGVGAHSASIRRRVSRDVFTVARGTNFTSGSATVGARAVVKPDDGDTDRLTLFDSGERNGEIDRIVVNEFATHKILMVTLNKPPNNQTKILISSNDISEATVDTSEILFDRQNWNTPVPVTVTGVDDVIVDGRINTTIDMVTFITNDKTIVRVSNNDNDGLELLSDTTTSESNRIILTENSANSNKLINLRLSKVISDNMNVTLVSSNINRLTIDTASIQFTSNDYDEINQNESINKPFIVNVVENTIAEGTKDLFVTATLRDSNSDFVDSIIFYFKIYDDEALRFYSTPLTFTPFVENVEQTVDVSLNAEPVSEVIISATNIDANKFTVTPSFLTFTSGNWSNNQSFTLIGVNNETTIGGTRDGSFNLSITSGGDGDVDYTSPLSSGTYTNPRTYEFIMYDSSKTIILETEISNTTIDEDGGTFTGRLKLSTPPDRDLTVSFADNNNILNHNNNLVFTTSDWNDYKSFSFTAKSDSDLSNSSTQLDITAPTGYETKSIGVTVNDNYERSINLSVTSLSVPEDGKATFDISLAGAPTSDVSVNFTLHNTTNFRIEPNELGFNQSNYSRPQRFYVSAINDDTDLDIADSSINIKILQNAGGYTTDISASIEVLSFVDNDIAAITTSLVDQSIVEGQTVKFDISLATLPTSDVSLVITTGSEGLKVDPSNIFIGDQNGIATVSDISLTAVSGSYLTGTYDVSINVTENSASEYVGLSLQKSIEYQNIIQAITTSTNSLSVDEGNYQVIEISLNSVPTGNVTVRIVLNDTTNFSVSPDTYSFDAGTQDLSTNFTIFANQDYMDTQVSDSSINIKVQSSDAVEYTTDISSQVTLVFNNQDTAAITTTLLNNVSIDEGRTVQFDISLASKPTSDVSLVITTGSAGLEVDPSHVYMEWDNVNNVIKTTDISLTALSGSFTGGTYDVSINTVTTAAEYTNLSLVRLATYKSAAITTTLLNNVSIDEGHTVNFDVSLATLPTSDVSLVITTGSDGLKVDPSNIFIGSNSNITVSDISLTALSGSFAGGTYDVSINTVTTAAEYTDISLVRLATYKSAAITTTLTKQTIIQGSTVNFDISLATLPTSDVSLVITTSSPGLTVDPSNMSITGGNTVSDISLTALSDSFPEGTYDISINTTTTSAEEYRDVSLSLVSLPKKTKAIMTTFTNQTIGEGNTVGFKVSLSTLPESDVSLVITTGSDGLEVDPSNIFISSNSNITVSDISLTALIGDFTEGTYDVSINTVTEDGDYTQLSLVRLATYKSAAITTTLLNNVSIDEGHTVNFDVSLATLPTSDVSLVITTGSDGLKVDPSNIFVGDENGIITVSDISLTALSGSFAGGTYDISINTVTTAAEYTDLSLVRLATYKSAAITTTLTNQTITTGNTVNFDISLATLPTSDVSLVITTGSDGLKVDPSNIFIGSNSNITVSDISLTALSGPFAGGTYDVSINTVTTAAEYTDISLVRQITYDRVECISPTSVVKIFGSKYTFNNKTAYEDVSYGLTTTTTTDTSYVLQDISMGHPIALLNNVITQVTYSPVDNTINPIEIKVSGGFSGDPYYTFKDKDDTTITIGPNNTDFKFMRGCTYKFTAQADDIDSDHPFELFVNGSTTTSIDENGGDITITIPSGHSTTAGDLYYQCSSHGSNMRKNMYLTYDLGPDNINSYDFYYGNVNVGVSGPFAGALSVYCLKHGYMGGQDLIVYKDTCTAP